MDRKQARIEELNEQLTERFQVEGKIKNPPDKIRDEMTYQERRQRMLDQLTNRAAEMASDRRSCR